MTTTCIKARFLSSLEDLINRKRKILSSDSHSTEEKDRLIASLKYVHGGGATEEGLPSQQTECELSDLGLYFVVNRPSSVFQYESAELIKNGSEIEVTVDNVEDYVQKCLEFYLEKGIEEQMAAFRDGSFASIDSVFHRSIFATFRIQLSLSTVCSWIFHT